MKKSSESQRTHNDEKCSRRETENKAPISQDTGKGLLREVFEKGVVCTGLKRRTIAVLEGTEGVMN